MSRRRIVTGVLALTGVIGILLIPSASYAAKPSGANSTTNQSVAGQSAPAPAGPSATLPPPKLPAGAPSNTVFGPIVEKQNAVSDSLCAKHGGSFCASR